MNSNLKGPLSPQDLFNRLFNGDFKQAECTDQTSRIRQQKAILRELIIEYEEEIKKAQKISIQEEKLLEVRQTLLVELDTLRKERLVIDQKVAEELNSLRVTPIDTHDHAGWVHQVTEFRGRNNKMRIRIKDLLLYIEKLQHQNRRLEEQRKVIHVNQLTRRQAGEDWRSRINALKTQHLSYEAQLRDKIRYKEQNALRNIQAQELEMRTRNQRRRMQTLYSKYNRNGTTPIKEVLQSRYIREI